MYELLYVDKLFAIFPNVEIAFFFTILPTNCSGERSFSQLSLIKNVHRSTVSQRKLNEYSVMCIKNELLQSININDIVDNFVLKKVRRKHM